jgi:hypothetical protein
MRYLTAHSSLSQALRNDAARRLLIAAVPDLGHPSLTQIPLAASLADVLATEPILFGDIASQQGLLAQLTSIDLDRLPADRVDGRCRFEPAGQGPTADTGTGMVSRPESASCYGRYELVLDGPDVANPFLDVDLWAIFTGPGGEHRVPGFADGGRTHRIRFMPTRTGRWTVRTSSNVGSLDGLTGDFTVTTPLPGAHGPVGVVDRFHFVHADGTPYRPIGTTCYAWTHQIPELEEQTLQTLGSAPFNKIRMCVFPKSYRFNENEPPLYPFPVDSAGNWDLERFEPDFFHHLERRIDQLGFLGVQADLILFHPYDRWGFSNMGPRADDHYLRYLVARLASFANVWWSMANEYDLMPDKSTADWERFAAVVADSDPVGHLTSIHNCVDFYDHSRPWITHASIQRTDTYKTTEHVAEWRLRWGKPVVVDECEYEGDIPQTWGNITGQEMTRRIWEGIVRGGYVGHGETYLHSNDVLWWSKGGLLTGTSPERIAFLRHIVDSGPRAGLEPVSRSGDYPCAGRPGQYLLYYLGNSQSRRMELLLEPSTTYEIDVIDTWAMTVDRVDGTFSGRFTVELPGRPYIAVRLTSVTSEQPV